MREDKKRGEAVEAPGAREKAARSSARLLRTPAKLQDADDAPPTTHPSVKERAKGVASSCALSLVLHSRRASDGWMPRVRVSIVGPTGTMPSKCHKCTVDAVVLVEPSHAAIARAAINKLRLKTKDERRVQLSLKTAVGEHAAGTELPAEGDLAQYLANDCIIIAAVRESSAPPKATDAAT